MTIQAFQTLYESSVAYGMRKALQAEQRKAEMLIKINQLEDTCSDLDSEVNELKNKIKRMLKKEKDESERDRQDHEYQKKSHADENT